ncbi:MAG: aminoglycoside phosphotransferase family protein [Sphaerochaeta associata]|uniref:aminoglycoside phosphotransferase family protein n=1 Tax=Sphaerochaeta associata TaxID=1129264 RepID=UPI002B1EA3A8|nr:aminoglycoside phosphotransferase family protein [Sphaerochaeta associata]MEA5027404.1 aminoglycoside phosphotransferase family protein [Sphaerochaeta associata]
MIDIADKNQLESYLLAKKLIDPADGYSITYCSGGVSGTVAFVMAGSSPMIIKQALAQLKVKETWLCDPNRMNIEQLSNQVYYEYVPTAVPKVYFYDEENYIYGREAAPESCTMWKSDLLSGLLDFEVARKSIEALAIVHDACSRDIEVAKTFEDKDVFYNLRISPYIEFTVAKYPQLQAYAQPIIDELMQSSITLVHGDFSPKNILVQDREIFILDFEVAHYGHPCFDLAFFANHFILKAVKTKAYCAAYLNMLEYMLTIYFSRCAFMDKKTLELSFIKLLALMQLARVDGKSPAESITSNEDKDLVRTIAFSLIEKQPDCFTNALMMIQNIIHSKFAYC